MIHCFILIHCALLVQMMEEDHFFKLSVISTSASASSTEDEDEEEVISKSKLVYGFSKRKETVKNIICFESFDEGKQETKGGTERRKSSIFMKLKSIRKRESESSPLVQATAGDLITGNGTTYNQLILTLKEIANHVNEMNLDDSEDTAQEESKLIKGIEIVKPPKISRRGVSLGYFACRTFLLPILPRICGDLWCFVQIVTALALLILSCVNTSYTPNDLFRNLSIFLSVIMFVFAITDGYCYQCCCYLCNKRKNDTAEQKENPSLCFKITTYPHWYEIIRTIASELLLYPLIVICLFELLNGSVFDLSLTGHKLVFSIFVISCAYIVLSVYLIPLLLIIATIIKLQGIVSSTSDYKKLFVRFFFHIFVQIFVHILCIASVGAKIYSENSNYSPNNSYSVSFFLWIVIIGGWVIPLMGALSVLPLNYYWLKMTLLDIFISTISYFEQQEFSEAVFQGQDAMEESEKILQITHYSDIKQETKASQDETAFIVKLLYPLRFPLFLLYAVVFDIAVGVFIVCLLLSYDDNGKLIADFQVLFVLTVIFIVIANIQILFLINFWITAVLIPLIISFPVCITIALIKKFKEILFPV